ncbi:metallophosphoesterase family protein [Halobacterium jilantaiense]|uniref:Phosphoesterase n=1 Tax=Halobacterium jilantaiense TaxID=355548 RepID=A0A1I0P8A5_9EURY|nr:metallophosphoesterase family protein [Halobacterium jilantaiense]SEW10362.1 phosphoesterase, MJ0936 family [Halobacterium jilantaiense]
MKIGVISDIHSNSIALEQVLEALSDRGVDEILCAGDLVGYGSQPNRVMRLLKIADVESVMGNHDEGVVNGTPPEFNVQAKRALDWNRRNIDSDYVELLDQLPLQIRKTIDGSEIFVVHGSPRNPLSEYIYESDLDRGFLEFSFKSPPEILVLGQTHTPFIKKIGDTLVINPGSVGQPRDGDPRASCAILDLAEMEAEILRVDYDQEAMAEDILEVLPKPLAERILYGE